MATVKTAITVPEDLLIAVDRAARERNESRSGFISRILRAAMRARRDAEITRRLEVLFAIPEVAQEQRRVARELDRAGTDWTKERW